MSNKAEERWVNPDSDEECGSFPVRPTQSTGTTFRGKFQPAPTYNSSRVYYNFFAAECEEEESMNSTKIIIPKRTVYDEWEISQE